MAMKATGESRGMEALQQFNSTVDRRLSHQEVLTPLVKAGILSPELAEKTLKAWLRSTEHPLSLLHTLAIPNPDRPGRYYSYETLAGIVARRFGLDFQRIDTMKLDLQVVGSLIPHAYADRLGVVPVSMDDRTVTIVTADPLFLSWITEVEPQLKRKVALKLGSPRQIKHLLNEIFVVQKAMKAFAKEQGKEGAQRFKLMREGRIEELDNLIEQSKAKPLNAQDSHVAKIVDWMLNYAVMERASDIHIEPKRGLGQIRFRVDGDLQTVYRLDHEILQMIIARFKILGEMKLDERRRPQDGGLKRTLENGMRVEMRLSTLPVNHGEKMVIRIFDKAATGDDLSFIGFLDEDRKLWESMVTQHQGMVLVTGPTGSGKTTTLYTTLNKIATPDVNVCTAEDPIEMEVDNFNQVQVNPQINMGFADCVRSLLRQDPDVIMVGEIRDRETGEMALQASLTGHMVFSTLHTNGALATIQRLVDLGLPTFLINSSLVGILSQRLVRKLCVHCKELAPTDRDKWALLMEGDTLAMPEQSYQAKGCEDCNGTGYHGRLCIYELVPYDDRLKRIVHQRVEITELKEKARGMFTPLRINGARKIIAGETTLEEVLKVAY